MKLILHHLLKDIRAQRWLLLLWAIILLVEIILGAQALQSNYDRAQQAEALKNSPLLIIASSTVWTLLLVRLIQSEPITGSTSFWLTRPIPLRVLASSKILFIFAFVVLPGLLPDLVDMLQLHAGTEAIKSQLELDLLDQVLGGLCMIWLATFTPNLFYFWGLLALIFTTFVLAATYLCNPTEWHSGVTQPTSPELTSTRTLLFAYILFGGLVLSLAVQYLRRKSGLRVGVATTLLAFAMASWWPVALPLTRGNTKTVALHLNFTFDRRNDFNWNQNSIGSVGISWGSAPKATMQAMGALTPVNPGSDGVPIAQSIAATFQPAGENDVELLVTNTLLAGNTYMQLQRMNPLNQLQGKLPGISLTSPNHDWSWDRIPRIPLFMLDSAMQQNLRGKTGTLILQIKGRMTSLEPKAVIPLNQPDFIASLPGGFVRVRPIEPKGNSSLEVWQVSSDMANLSSPTNLYVLVDPQTRSGSLLQQGGNSSQSLGLVFHNKSTSTTELNLARDEPLDRMILYVFGPVEGAAFESTLSVPDSSWIRNSHCRTTSYLHLEELADAVDDELAHLGGEAGVNKTEEELISRP